MSKKAIIGIISLVFVLVLVGVALLLLPKATGKNAAKEGTKSLSDFSYLDITGIDLERPDGLIKLRLNNKSWYFEEDPSFDLDQNSAVAVATNCSYLSAEELVSVKKDELGALGLAPAQYKVQVYLKDGSSPVYLIGLQTMDKKGRYAMVQGGDKIVVIPDYADKAFTTPKQNMINRSTGSIDWADLTKLELKKSGEADLIIERNNDPIFLESNEVAMKYLETSPYKVFANPTALKNIAKNLPELSFDEFVETAQALTAYGLEAPRLTIAAYDGGGNQLSFNVGDSFEKEGQLFYYCNRSRDPQHVFSLSNKKVEFLNLSPISAADPLPVPQREEEIPKQISVSANNQLYVIDIVNSDLALNGSALSSEKGEELIIAFYDIRIVSGVENAVKGELVASYTIDFGTRKAKVDFYTIDEERYVVDQGFGPSVCVSKAVLDGFLQLLNKAAAE